MATAGFHFLFTLIALYAARLHVRHHHLAPFLFAFLAFFPDLDFFFGIHRATLHNLFITLLAPLAILLLTLRYSKNIVLQESVLLSLLVLISHPAFDLFYGPVELLYPLSRKEFSLSGIQLTAFISGSERVLISAPDFGMLAFVLLLVPAFFLEELLELRGIAGAPTRYSLAALRKQVEGWMREL